MEEVGYYDDPERYQAEYSFLAADVEWYRRHTLALGGPALVLGCGTGRHVFHLAAAGLDVDGIDNAPAMLDFARSRAVPMRSEITRRVQFFSADMRRFSLPRKYRTVLAPLNCLMHLHSDDEMLACLGRVKSHLTSNGGLLFDVAHPRPELLANTDDPRGVPLREIRVRGVTYLQRERHEYHADTGISEAVFQFEPRETGLSAFQCRLRLRMFSATEIEDLLHRAGFVIEEKFGNFQDQPFRKDGISQIFVARPALIVAG